MEILLSEKISDLRSYLGLSQAAFSKPLCLSPTHIARFEKGRSIPAQETIEKICHAYDIDPEYFTGTLPVEAAVKKQKTEAGVGERLRLAREEKGWSQNELAKRSGVSQSIINRVESGAKLTDKQGVKVAETLEVGYDWLMTGDEKKKKYPADKKMVDWLWENEKARSDIWRKMNAV